MPTSARRKSSTRTAPERSASAVSFRRTMLPGKRFPRKIAAQPSASACSGPRRRRGSNCFTSARCAFLFLASAAPWRPPRARGALPATGGGKTRGNRRSGTWKFFLRLPRIPAAAIKRRRNAGHIAPSNAASIACFSIPCGKAGLCVAFTIEAPRLKYTELHARSAFSFLEGACVPEDLASKCAEREMGALALLDRDGVYGSPRFYLAAKKLSIQAHIGAEITSEAGWRYAVLVKSRAGYQNLCRLITRMKLRAKKGEGHVLPEEVSESAGGLVCLTGGDEGPLASALTPGGGGFDSATKLVERLCQQFGRRNVYVELQRHFCRDEEARNQAALAIAQKLKLPLVATNGVSYAHPAQREILDVFSCIRHHRTLAGAGRLLSRNSERHLKSPAEMARLFADLPEAIANTQSLSARLQFTLKDLGYQFPKYPVPGGESQIHFLRERSREGMLWRYGNQNEKARAQIERELAMIEKLDLPGYFLIVWDIVRFCRQQNILVQGRGSAANSAVC